MPSIALSPAIQEQITEAQVELARRRLKHFCLRMNPRLQLQPYHDLIFDALEELERGEITRLVISAPPRHSKTEIVSRKFVAWLMGRNPEAQVILASYGTDLARNASRDARNLLAEPLWPFPDVTVAKDASSAEEWATVREGKVKAAGVGAGITGYGADYLIVDDPFKGAEDAYSKTARDKVWEWYVNEARTRLMPGGKIILICTRWHQVDLIGRALTEAKEDGREDEWKVLRLPAIAEANDPAGRQPGEALDPRRYPVHYLKQFMGITRTWNALYQQNPIPDSGTIFHREWWQYYDPEDLARLGLKAKFIYVDPAFGGNAQNDETAGTVWGTLGGKLYWMDTFHERVPYHELKKRLGHFYAKWRVPLVIEDNGWSQILVNELRSPTPGDDGEISFPVIPYKLPGGNRSKTERAISIKTATAESVTTMVEGGMVFLPRGASWLDYALDQLTTFPAAKHDDICLVAGTPIATPFGDKPIEEIQSGDLAITPLGIKRVLSAGQTGIANVISRNGVTGTGAHPMFIHGDGFLRMDTITMAQKCDHLSLGGLLRWRYLTHLDGLNSSSSSESRTGSWGRSVITSASRSPMRGGSALKDFMWRSGKLLTNKQYQKAGTFITGTVIRSTTTLAIWSAYWLKTIARSRRSSLTQRLRQNISNAFDRWLPNGIDPKLDGLGIEKTASESWQCVSRFNWLATLVAQNSRPFSLGLLLAPISAGSASSARDLAQCKMLSASSAQSPSQPLFRHMPTESLQRVDDLVDASLDTEGLQQQANPVPVYNLTVEDAGCYYAAGVLVSNCDSVVMALTHMGVEHSEAIDKYFFKTAPVVHR